MAESKKRSVKKYSVPGEDKPEGEVKYRKDFALKRPEDTEFERTYTKNQNTKELERELKEAVTLSKLVEGLYSAENEEEFFEILYKRMLHMGYQKVILGLFDEEKRFITLKELGRKVSADQTKLEGIFTLWAEKRSFISDDIVTKMDIASVPVSEIFKQLPRECTDVTHSVIGIPLVAHENVWGGFAVFKPTMGEPDFMLLEKLGKVAGPALQRLHHHLALRRKVEGVTSSLDQFHLLQEINNALNSTMDLEQILQILVKGLHTVFGYETPSVYLLDADEKALVVKEYYMNSSLAERVSRLVGFRLKDYHIPLYEGSRLKKALETKTPLVTNDIPDLLRDFTNSESMRKLAYPLFALGHVKWLAALPLIANNEPVGMLVVTRKDEISPKDIQDLQGFLQQASLAIKRAELHRQLRESLERVREANQMKSQFIDITSHELRTPLTSMRLYLDMIQIGKYGNLSEELQERMAALREATDRLQEIIDQTLTSSQIIRHKLVLTKTEISVGDLIKEVVFHLEPVWKEKGQRIKVKTKKHFPLVKADKKAIQKVMNALLGNAIKYSGKSSKITVKLYDESEEVKIAVSDEGIGILPEYKEKIFEEFFIVPSEREYARTDGRTGLGLFISKGIVEEHGGRIWVESSYGKGSTFYFTLPKGS